MIEVGLTKTLPTGKKTRYKYSDIDFNSEGWAKVPCFYPLKFDLVQGKTLAGKIATVWWTGICWMGLRLPERSRVIEWRRIFNGSTAA